MDSAEDKMPYWRKSKRESVFGSLVGENTTSNFPERAMRVHLSEADQVVRELVEKAKSLKMVETEEQVKLLLGQEEQHREKRRRQEVLFSEGVGRMTSFVIATLEDEAFLSETERTVDISPGTVK